MKIGYGRVSTTDQNPRSQELALSAAGAEKLFIDTYTGTKLDRPQLNAAWGILREGDSLMVTRLDRLGRSLRDLLDLVSKLDELKVNLVVIEQSIDTTSPEGRLFFHMVGAFSEFERELIRTRTLDGLHAARQLGRVGGRKEKLSQSQQTLVRKMHSEGEFIKTIAEAFNVSRPTIYRVLEKENILGMVKDVNGQNHR